MVLNMFMSLSALIRYDQRNKKIPASNFFERYLDTHYNDQRREQRPKKEIGISAVRGGTIVGEHEIIFAGQDEVLS